MKKLFTLSMVIIITLSALSQAPQIMSYQCVVRNGSGVLVTNQAVGIKISILQGSASGTVVFSETYSPNPQTNANGLLTIEIGSGSTITGTFTGINWASGPYFLKTETDPTGGTSYTIVGTSQLLSVPYALHAKSAATADYNDLSNLPTLNISNWNTAYGWGNHAGLYRTIGWVPAWTDVIGKPTFATVATSGSYSDLSNKPTILNSQWTTSGSNIYYNTGNVGIGTNNPATYIHGHGSPVTSRGQLSLSAPSGQDIFLSFYEANTFKSYLWFNAADQDLRLQNYTAGDLNLNPYGGNVGIGTNTPGAKLEVAGQIKITGGTPAVGQVLTSDGTGLATWEPPAGSSSHTIGESYGGGIVFYVYDNGRHGLIAATADQSTGVVWTNYAFQHTVSNAVRDGINGGLANTERIIIQAGAGSYAAQLCANYKGGNYADWYLPSKYELNLLYLQKAVVGGFANYYYWSSTEYDTNSAWEQAFANGNQANYSKDDPGRVRAVRAF